MIVVVAILAVMVLVLAPKLLSYNERSRAEKDNSSMDEVVNAIQLALADQEIYDEVLRFSTVDNVSCYVDTNSEANYSKVVTKSNPDGVDQYTFTSSARQLDETPYFAAGNMRGVTITFAPDKGSNGSDFDLKQGVVNQYVQVSGNQRFGAMPKLYNRVRSSVGDVITNTSQTYRNSEYTVFIVMGTIGGNDEGAQDATKFYGQWSGTNLPAQVQYQIVSDRTVGDTGNTIVDVDDSNWNQTNGNKLTLKPGDLNGGGSFTPTTNTGNQCAHENTEIAGETETHTGNTVCTDCNEIVIESTCKHINIEIRNGYLPTQDTQGYSGDKYCSDCDELLENGLLYDCTHETTEIKNETDQYTGDECCTVCGIIINSGEVIVQGVAYAIYSKTDNSLCFYKNTDEVQKGDTYNGKVVTDIFTGIETLDAKSEDDIPWHKNPIYTAVSIRCVDKITPISTAYWFYDFYNCGTFDLTKLDTSKVTSMSNMFRMAGASVGGTIFGISNWDVSNVTDMSWMFANAFQTGSYMFLNLSGWDVSSVTNMSYMFHYFGTNVTDYITLNLEGWNTCNVLDMNHMFTYVCGNKKNVLVEFDGLPSWNVSNVQDMSYMFHYAGSKASVFAIGDLSSWDTSNVTNMSYMFNYAGKYYASHSQNLSGWNVNNVIGRTSFNGGVASKITPPVWKS